MHVIHKHTVDFSFHGDEEDSVIMNYLEAITKEKMIPELEKVFDRMDQEGVHYRIENLTLDLGTLAYQDLERDLVEKLHHVCRVKLQSCKGDAKKTGEPDKKIAQTNKGWIEASKGTSEADHLKEETITLTEDEVNFELFVIFSKTGSLPWWYSAQAKKDSGTSRLPEQKIVQALRASESRVRKIMELLQVDTTLNRIVSQFSSGFLSALWDEMIAIQFSKEARGKKIRSTLKAILLDEVTTKRVPISADSKTRDLVRRLDRLYKRIGFNVSIVKQSESRKQVWINLFRSLFLSEDDLQARIASILKPTLFKSSEYSEVEKELESVVARLLQQITQKPEIILHEPIRLVIRGHARAMNISWSGQTLSKTNTIGQDAAQATRRLGSQPKKQVIREHQSAGDLEAGVIIENAGVVLLHPFLPRLFNARGLVKGNQFLSTSHQARAAHLIQYLATGGTAGFEFEMPLCKILTGIPMEDTLDRFVPLTVEDREECDALLRSAISHWAVLGNTSPDGLRNEFLRRAGRLQELNEREWTLDINQKSQDILLTRLPWSISIIKYGWMTKMIRVNWS